MDDKIKEEEFNLTEIKIKEIESGISDDWKVMPKFENYACSIPYTSVPKMREFVDENDSTSCATCKESDRQNEQGISSQHHQESERERKDEHKQENKKLGREMSKTKPSQSFQQDQKDKNKGVMRDSDEVLRYKLFRLKQIKENQEEFKRDIDEFKQEKFNWRKEIKRCKGKFDEKMQLIPECEQAMDSLMQALSIQRQDDRIRREVDEVMQVASQNKQEVEMFRREMEEAMERHAFSLRAAQRSKPRLAKSKENKGQVLEFNEAFQQFCKVKSVVTDRAKSVVSDKVKPEASKDDKLEKEKDLRLKMSSKDLKSFRDKRKEPWKY